MTSDSPYWCGQKLVVTIDGPEGPSLAVIDKPFVRIGSHEGSDIVLPGNDIPRRCLYLHATDQGIYWIGLRGVRPGGDVIGGWLRKGRRLNVGRYGVRAKLVGENNAESQPTDDWLARGSAPPPFPVLEISGRGERLGQRALTRRLTVVGRRKPAAIGLSSRSVSVCHCVLYADPGGLWAIDLLSKNRTRAENQATEVARLAVGTTLKLGVFELVLSHFSDSRETEYILRHVADPHDASSSEVALRGSELAEAGDQRQLHEVEMEQRLGDLVAREAALLEDKKRFERERRALDKGRSNTPM